MLRFTISILMACILFSATFSQAQQPPATITRSLVMAHMSPKSDQLECWMNAVYAEAFKRLGYEMKYLYLPAARATAMADHFEIDGELGRTRHYGLNHPNLVRVEESVFVETVNIYMTRELKNRLNLAQLTSSRYVIAYLRGQPRMEKKLASIPKERKYRVNSTLTGLRMLQAGRVDAYIGPHMRVGEFLSLDELASSKIRNVSEVESQPIHGYLTKEHRELAHDLAGILKKNEG